MRGRRVCEGGVYLKSNSFLANSNIVTDHFNFYEQKHFLGLVSKVIFYIVLNLHVNTTATH